MNKFELETTKIDGEVIEIKNFEETLNNARAIIENNPVFVVTNDNEKAIAKTIRANLNKVLKAIKTKRINDIANLVSTYESQCKELESLFDEAQKKFGEEIKRYEESEKAEDVVVNQEATLFVATIKFTDAKIVEKLTNFCIKNNLTLTIK